MADQCASRRTSRTSFLKSLDEAELPAGAAEVAPKTASRVAGEETLGGGRQPIGSCRRFQLLRKRIPVVSLSLRRQ